MNNTVDGKPALLQDGARELTSEEIDLVSGGIARPKPDGGGDGTSPSLRADNLVGALDGLNSVGGAASLYTARPFFGVTLHGGGRMTVW